MTLAEVFYSPVIFPHLLRASLIERHCWFERIWPVSLLAVYAESLSNSCSMKCVLLIDSICLSILPAVDRVSSDSKPFPYLSMYLRK